jgi:hypothetical protein
MTDWPTPACGLLDGGSSDAVTLACLVVAVLLVGAIAAGFVAAWTAPRARRAPAGRSIGDARLLDLWRLCRQRGSATPARRPRPSALATSADGTRAAGLLGIDR